MFPWVPWTVLSNPSNLGRASWDLLSYSCLVKTQVTIWTCSWHLKWGGGGAGRGRGSDTISGYTIMNELNCNWAGAAERLDLSHTGCQRYSSFGVTTKGGGDLSAFLFTLDFLTPGCTLNSQDFPVFALEVTVTESRHPHLCVCLCGMHEMRC